MEIAGPPSAFSPSLADMYGEDPRNPDKLHPELRRYYERRGPLGPQIRHPLLYDIPFMSWKLANLRYEQKQKAVDEAWEERDIGGVLAITERPYRLEFLLDWWSIGHITDEEFKRHLPWVWVDTENDQQVGWPRIIRAFKRIGFITDHPDEITGVSEPVTVYRGGNYKYEERGPSWTGDIRTARFFARRFLSRAQKHGGKGYVWACDVPPEQILARFMSRGEDEYIVNLRGLKPRLEEEVGFD